MKKLITTIILTSLSWSSSSWANPRPSTHNYFHGSQRTSPYLTTHDSLAQALERIDYLRQRSAKSLFMGKIGKINIELLGIDTINTKLDNTFLSLGAFGSLSRYEYLNLSDMSQNKIYELHIKEFKNTSELKIYKTNLGSNTSLHYEGHYKDFTLDLRSINLNYNGLNNGVVLIYSKATEVERGSISIQELKNLQNKLNKLYAKQKMDKEIEYISVDNREESFSNRESKIFSGSETEIFHDFKFENNAYERAARAGYGDCKTISYSSSVDIKDVWERDVYSIVCYRL